MFGARYFGARYFGSRYWGTSPGTVTPPEPPPEIVGGGGYRMPPRRKTNIEALIEEDELIMRLFFQALKDLER